MLTLGTFEITLLEQAKQELAQMDSPKVGAITDQSKYDALKNEEDLQKLKDCCKYQRRGIKKGVEKESSRSSSIVSLP